jgi:flagellar biosynthesis protein FlhG
MNRASEWLNSFSSQHKDHVETLINQKRQSNQKTTVVSVTAGKGGVGKTSISVKMAKELAHFGFKVLLLDCDTNLSNTAIKLGLPLDNIFYELVSGTKEFTDCIYKEGNFHLLAACNGSIDLFDRSFGVDELMIDVLHSHGHEYDFVIFDCPAGLSKETMTINAYSDFRIVVVTPDRSSITDSYSLIKILSQKYSVKDFHLVINMYQSQKQFERIVRTLSETTENFLGARTSVLGGLKRLDLDPSRFDTFFLENKENEIHKSFIKVVNRLTEQLSRSADQSHGYSPEVALRRSEQEVQPSLS